MTIEAAFTGTIGSEPSTRTTKTGKPWLAFPVAVVEGDVTTWVQVAVFGDNVPDLAARLRKGVRVYVEGKLTLRAWTDADGRERSGLSVASFHVSPMGQIGRKRPADQTQRRASSGNAAARRNYAAPQATADRGTREPIPAHYTDVPDLAS